MKLEKIFRALVALNLFVVLLNFYDFNQFIQSEYELEEIIAGSDAMWTLVFESSLIFSLFYLFAALACLPLLFFYVNYSRELFLFVISTYFFVSIVGGFTGDYQIGSSVYIVLGELESVIDGLILALAYFTPLKENWSSNHN